jgi:hypothetical protein
MPSISPAAEPSLTAASAYAFAQMSGDATANAAGAITFANTGVTAGNYTNANITIDSKGRVTAAANGLIAVPGGTSGQVQYNNAGSFGGFTVSGDGTLNTATRALTITKTNGTAFTALATASPTALPNIALSGGATAKLNPNYQIYSGSVTSPQTNTTPAMMGFGWLFTPKISGNLKVWFVLTVTATTSNGLINLAPIYGTGSAPSLGSPQTGTALIGGVLSATPQVNVSSYSLPALGLVSGLKIGTPIWIDFEAWVASGSGGFEISSATAFVEELFG